MITSPYGDLADLRPRRREVALHGTRTRCWVYGPPDAMHTIIMVHGFRGDHHGMEPLAAHLPGHRVIIPDLPGFGASTPFTEQQHSVASYAAWLIDLVREFAVPVERTTVIGHSFGSVIVAAAIAQGLPSTSAVLVNPIAARALEGPRRILSAAAVAYYRLGACLPEALGAGLLGSRVVVRGLSTLMAKTRDRRLRRWIHDQHHRYFSGYADRRVVLEAFTASVGDDVGSYATSLDLPVLLIGGDRDDITSAAAQRALATRLPRARLVMISEVGHLIHYEAPGRAAESIEEFVRAS